MALRRAIKHIRGLLSPETFHRVSDALAPTYGKLVHQSVGKLREYGVPEQLLDLAEEKAYGAYQHLPEIASNVARGALKYVKNSFPAVLNVPFIGNVMGTPDLQRPNLAFAGGNAGAKEIELGEQRRARGKYHLPNQFASSLPGVPNAFPPGGSEPPIPPPPSDAAEYGWEFRKVGKGTNIQGAAPGFDVDNPPDDMNAIVASSMKVPRQKKIKAKAPKPHKNKRKAPRR